MKPIAKQRSLHSSSAKRLRRARRLYMRLCMKAVLESKDDRVMHAMILKMKEHGLYIIPDTICWRSFRFSICRYLWRHALQQDPRCGDWHFWYRRMGFDNNFSREHLSVQIA